MIQLEIEKNLKIIDQVLFERLVGDMVPYIYNLPSGAHINKKGVVSGELRTRKGTPDILILSDVSNIAIQCSIDKNLPQKIEKDIARCIEEFDTEDKVLNEICFCYNGSIDDGLYQNIFNKLKEKDIRFRFVGIDDLTMLLYTKCPIIASDYLNVKFSDGTLKSITELKKQQAYIQEHDGDFYFREEDKTALLSKIEKGSVIVTGKPGDGKTRIVLEVAELWKNTNFPREVFILNNNTFDITNDFNRFFNQDNVEYLLIIDDINRLSIFDRIYQYVSEKNNIKILATVRDYALSTIESNYGFYFSILQLKSLNNENIKKIISNNYGIKNAKYLDYIMNVSKNNLRFAILTAKTIKNENNKYPKIEDILKSHFTKIFKDLNLIENNLEERFLKVLGIFSFIQKLYLTDKDQSVVNKILQTFNLTIEDFSKSLYFWDEKEIIKLIFDKNIAVMDDQILRSYIFHFVFIEKKLLSLEELFTSFLRSHRGNIIDCINSINYVYGYDDYLIDKILDVQKNLFDNNDSLLFTYLDSLGLAHPSESIDMIEDKLNKGEANYIELMHHFVETEYVERVTKILISQYRVAEGEYKKNIEKILVDNYGVNKTSYDNHYEAQITLLQSILNEECISNEVLFKIIKKHCNFCFESTESKQRSLTIYNIPLIWCDEVKVYRKLLWDLIMRAYKSCEHQEMGILSESVTNYRILNVDKNVENYEIDLIDVFIKSIKTNKTENIVLKYELLKHFHRVKKGRFSVESIVRENEILQLLELAEKSSYKWPENYNRILVVLKDKSLTELKRIIKQLSIYTETFNANNTWLTYKILHQMLLQKKYKDFSRFDVFRSIISQFPDFDLGFGEDLKILSDEVGLNKLIRFIKASNLTHKWNYLIFLYGLIEKIDDQTYNECVVLFGTKYEAHSVFGVNQLENFERYYEFNNNFYIEISTLMMDANNKNKCLILSSLFESDNSKTYEWYSKDTNLLADIYFLLLQKHSHLDYEKKHINNFISKDIKNLDRYLDIAERIDLKFLWERLDWKEIILYACQNLIKREILSRFKMEKLLAFGKIDQVEIILNNLIQENIDNRSNLFELMSIVETYPLDFQKKYIYFLMELNVSREILLKIPIAGGPHSWSGSREPYVKKNIKLLEEIKDELKDKGYLNYMSEINQLLVWRKNELKRTQIEEYNEGFF